MSGGDAVSPFTSPQAACGAGLAAGNTDTAVRQHLLDRGHAVFTAPAMNAPGVVVEPDPASFGAFGDMPPVLPEHLTVNSVGDIDAAGASLARFVGHLHDTYGVDEVDWVGHSNGGLFARSATRILRRSGTPVTVRSLTALGTPWLGGVPTRYVAGEITIEQAAGDPHLVALFEGFKERAAEADLGLVAEDTEGFLCGPDGWNAAQAGVLDGIPVLLVAGTWFEGFEGDPAVWPLDGLVSRSSALALGLDADVLPMATRLEFPVTHSIWVSDQCGLPWPTGMTWNPDVLDAVAGFLDDVRG
jgi:pimeloyl-ACP methyl ester carboxylesterase